MLEPQVADLHLRGCVTHWIYPNGAEPRLGPDEPMTLSGMYVKSGDALACVAQALDGGVFVFDMRWGATHDRFPHEIDTCPVVWYGSTDEAIVKTMMDFETSCLKT